MTLCADSHAVQDSLTYDPKGSQQKDRMSLVVSSRSVCRTGGACYSSSIASLIAAIPAFAQTSSASPVGAPDTAALKRGHRFRAGIGD